jgi:hypothetical protein
MSITRTRKALYDMGIDSTKLKKSAAKGTAPALTAISTADGADAATTQALANGTKAKVNEIITLLKNAGLAS